MTEREKILGRIREALTLSAPHPAELSHGHGPDITFTGRPVTQARGWLPPGGNDFAEQCAAFAKASTELKTDFRILNSREEAGAVLKEIAAAQNWQRIASHRTEATDAVCASLGLPLLRVDGGYDVHALEKCDAGITECDALVAQTGSVLVSSRSAGGRALSVLPPHHVVLARREQLVPDLTAAFALVRKKYAPDYPSMLSFITGPSRTGDIERILVLGAHGPKQLTVLFF